MQMKIFTFIQDHPRIKNTGNLQFHGKELDVPASIADMVKENRGILIGNYKDISEKIRPYEAVVYLTK